MLTKLEITKKIASTVVGVGAGKIVGNIILNNLPSGGIVTKITVLAGSIVIGMMASDATANYTSAKIDEAVAMWNNAKTESEAE